MYQIKKFVLTPATATESAQIKQFTVPFPSTELLRYIDEIGIAADALAVVDHSFDKEHDNNHALQDMLENAIQYGIQYNAVVYVPVMAGASNMRNAKSLWCDSRFVDIVRKWFCLDVNTRALSANKAAKYAALTMSSSMPWGEAFPDNGMYGLYQKIDINRVAVFKDTKNEVLGFFDEVFPDHVNPTKKMSIEAKFTDGMSLYVVDDSKLTPNQRQRVIRNMEAFTFRAAWFKGLAVPVLKSTLCQWFLDHDKSMLIKDFWGNVVNLRDLQLISFATTFKAAKVIPSWEDFKKTFKEFDREFFVCVTAHSRKLDIPYQQMQTVEFDGGEIKQIVDRHYEMIHAYTDAENAPKLLSGDMGKVVALVPELMNFWFIRQQMQTAYANKRRKVLGGRYMLASYNPFAAPDPVAVLEHLSGMTISGQIAPKQVSCRLFDEKRIDVTRCPHLDHAHAVRDNIHVKEYEGLYLGNTCFFAIGDSTMPLLQMDYDGDHVNVTDDPIIVNAALRTSKHYGNAPLTYPAMDAGNADAGKRIDFKRLLVNIKAAPVGLYANTLTKVWAGKKPSEEGGFIEIHDAVAYLTRRANTCIDAATHGDDSSSGEADALVKKLSKTPLPYFHKFAKGKLNTNGVDVVPQKSDDKYMVYDTSCLDAMTVELEKRLDKILHVAGYDGEQLLRMSKEQIAILKVQTGKPDMRIENLIRTPMNHSDDEGGLFNQIAKRRADEWGQLNENNSLEHVSELDNDTAALALQEIETFANKAGYTLDDAYNAIVNELFKNLKYDAEKPKFLPQLHRTFWVVFGKKALETVLTNLENGGVDVSKVDLADDDYEAEFDMIDSDEAYFE